MNSFLVMMLFTSGSFLLKDIGQPQSVRLSGTVAEHSFVVPAPAEIKPQMLSAAVVSSPGIRSGMILLENEGRTLATVPLPLSAPRIQIPITGALIKDRRMNLKLRAVLNPEDTLCNAQLMLWLEFSDMSVDFAPSLVRPATITGFWPPDLAELHVYVPSKPTPAETYAVFKLAALASQIAKGHGSAVRVFPFDAAEELPEVDSNPFIRSVVVREAMPSEVRLEFRESTPVLLVSGNAGSLKTSIDGLVGTSRDLLFGTREWVASSSSLASTGARQQTLEQLGSPQIQMQGSGQMETDIRFSQADFGGPVKAASVRLAGSYSPVPEGGTASLAVMLNDGLVTAVPLDHGGPFDMYVPFPASLLRRDNRITVRVLYTPPGGNCTVGAHNMIIRIDGGSYVEANQGQVIAEGFERFPQAFEASFQVAADDLNTATLQSGAQMINALQRLSRTPLQFNVVNWNEALGSRLPFMGVAISSRSTNSLHPPLELEPFAVVDGDGRQLLRLEGDGSFAALQAFSQNGRDVLLLSHRNAPEELPRLTAGLAQGNGWFDLDGDIWVKVPEQEPLALRVRGSGLRVEPLAPSPAIWWDRLRIYVFALGLIVTIGFLFVTYPKIVRKRATAA